MSSLNQAAFPLEGVSTGMMLRDYFAAHANIPWEVAAHLASFRFGENVTVPQIMRILSNLRYEQADAMLKAREE